MRAISPERASRTIMPSDTSPARMRSLDGIFDVVTVHAITCTSCETPSPVVTLRRGRDAREASGGRVILYRLRVPHRAVIAS